MLKDTKIECFESETESDDIQEDTNKVVKLLDLLSMLTFQYKFVCQKFKDQVSISNQTRDRLHQ